MIDTILGTVNTLLGWIPVPFVQNSTLKNVIRAAGAALALVGAYWLVQGRN